jgi:hypothetical protein
MRLAFYVTRLPLRPRRALNWRSLPIFMTSAWLTSRFGPLLAGYTSRFSSRRCTIGPSSRIFGGLLPLFSASSYTAPISFLITAQLAGGVSRKVA